MSKVRILVVEDEPSIRFALEALLLSEGYAVRAEPEGSRAEEVSEAFRPDLAILDVRLPFGPDGFTICRRLRRMGDIPTLFLTAADSLEDRLEGFRSGGDDYLAKPYATEELLARIDVLLRRSGRRKASRLHLGDLVVDTDSRSAFVGDVEVGLTHTEYELLAALAQHRGQVLSKVQLLIMVWGSDAKDSNLVEVHVSSLRRKLEAVAPRIVHTVRGSGYVLRG